MLEDTVEVLFQFAQWVRIDQEQLVAFDQMFDTPDSCGRQDIVPVDQKLN